MKKLIVMCMATVATAIGAYASFEGQMNLDGHVTYLVVAAVAVPIFAAFLSECYVTAWRRRHKLLAIGLFGVFGLCSAQVFLAAADRMHTAQAGPEAARNAARAAVADTERAAERAEAKADKAEADARAQRKLPRAPANKKATAGSWCDTGCLKRWDDEATAARQRATEARDAVTQARGKAVTNSTLSPAVWLLPACIDLAGITLWPLVALLPWPKRKEKPVKGRSNKNKRTRKPKAPAPVAPAQNVVRLPLRAVTP